MKLDEKEVQYIQRVRKLAQMPLWPSIGALFSAACSAIFNKDKLGLEGLIVIEFLVLMLIAIVIVNKRRERKLIDIVSKLLES